MNDIKQFIDTRFTYALIGASPNPLKYGHKVFVDLHNAGFVVLPVHLRASTLLGVRVYASLSVIKEHIDVVIFVVPPAVSLNVLPSVVRQGITKVWFQPGSDDDATTAFCKEHHINYVVGHCIMKERLNI